MNDHLLIAAQIYGGIEASIDLLHPELVKFLNRAARDVERVSEVRGIQDGTLRSSQIVALACLTWEKLNPGRRAYEG